MELIELSYLFDSEKVKNMWKCKIKENIHYNIQGFQCVPSKTIKTLTEKNYKGLKSHNFQKRGEWYSAVIL